MIPKIIHYCWLSGDPIPADLKGYMKSWKRVLPDYEFMLWDTRRFNIEQSQWVKQAFEHRKYAFAADYIRLYALYNYGGIYLDMDVEVLKSFNPLLSLHMMAGLDHSLKKIEAATWGAEKGHPAIKLLLDMYDSMSFIKPDGSMSMVVMPELVSERLKAEGYTLLNVNSLEEAQEVERKEKVIPVFPRTWFCPLNWYDYKPYHTRDTVSIHHYKGSWLPENVQRERNILSKLGPFLPRVWRRLQEGWRKVFGKEK